jgi:hypothetical protein
MSVAVSAEAQNLDLGAGGADQIWHGVQPGANAGLWLDQGPVGAGDTRRDLIVGAPGNSSTTGTVYILFGGPVRSGEFVLTAANVIIDGASPGDRFGQATAAGNVRATEASSTPRDLVVGAPGAFGNRGAVYLFVGGFTNGHLSTANSIFRVIGDKNDELGATLATADLNNDGYREIIMGAPGTGRVYVIYGSPTLSGTRDLMNQSADFGYSGTGIGSVLAAGDVTNDGIYDLTIGNPTGNAVYLIRGASGARPSGSVTALADAIFTGADPGDRAGASLRVADLDGDRRNDLFIGAPDADGPGNTRANAGEIYVLWGSASLSSRSLAVADVTIFGISPFLQTGAELTAGDVNRDTPNDLVMLASGGSNDAGELHVYYGRERAQMGTLLGDGRRVVDLAQTGQIDRRIFGSATLGRLRSMIVFEVTGEGARDILTGIPTNQSSTGAVFFTISPKMALNQNAISLTVPEGAARSTGIAVNNVSSIAITWAAAPTVPWAAANPDSGSSVAGAPGAFNAVINAGTLPVGTHSGRISVRSTSRDLEMVLPIDISLTITQARYMMMTAPAGGSTVTLPFTVRGWAIDTAVPTGTGVDAVDIYAIPSGGSAFLLGRAVYGQSRPEVGSTHGARFTNSGFEYQVAALGSGSFRIEARASSAGGSGAWTKTSGGVIVNVQGGINSDDFSGDGRMDLLWQHNDGRIAGWRMNGTTMVDGLNITPSSTDPAWQLVATADLNGDKKPDLLWQHRDGWLAAWLMNGSTILDGAMLNPNRVDDPAWKIAGTADLNGDGKEDIIWQHSTQGLLAAWLMNGTNILDGQLMNPNHLDDPAWKIAGTGDLNGDKKADLIFQHQTNGMLAVWYMNGANMADGRLLNPTSEPDTGWRIGAIGDLNGDGRVDFVWQHRDGRVRAWLMNNADLVQSVPLTPAQVDPAWRLAGPR